MKHSYNVYENGHCFASVEAASARGALRTAARKYPRCAADYNMLPSSAPWWQTWGAARPGVDGFEAECQVLIPATGRLGGAGRSCYRTEILTDRSATSAWNEGNEPAWTEADCLEHGAELAD